MDNREHDSRSGQIASEVGGSEESVHHTKHHRDAHKASTRTVETNLKGYPTDPPGSHRRLRLIAEAASEYWDLTIDEMKDRDRRPQIVWPRSVCMYLGMREGYTSTAVGKWWADRKHGSVLNAVKVVNDLIDTREAYKKQLRQFVIFQKRYIQKHLQP
jgi:chromosomal replication initiation ATPase DnaA